jgi:hypothetical protein
LLRYTISTSRLHANFFINREAHLAAPVPRHHALVPVYVKVVKSITRQIVLGIILLTLSGIGWLLLAYPITMRLVLKLILVGAIWVRDPIIDNVVEPKFRKLAPTAGEVASPEFIRIQKQYLTLEAMETGLFYVIIMMWVLA